MGRMKPDPRYNVLSCRVSDELRKCVGHALAGRTVQEYLHAALEEKLTRDRQARLEKLGC